VVQCSSTVWYFYEIHGVKKVNAFAAGLCFLGKNDVGYSRGFIMTIEQTIEIPDSRRIYVDLPPQVPAGKARIAINIVAYAEADTQPDIPREGSLPDKIEAFSDEEEATKFVTRLSKKVINESW
jgi:hypothetical protein